MAVEVVLGIYRFSFDLKAQFESRMRSLEQDTRHERPVCRTFSHNALHDLESLWWVCVWELLFYPDKSGDQMADEDVQRRRDSMYKLFPRTTEINHRLTFLEEGRVFLRMLEWMPEDCSIFISLLDILRMHLVLCYETFDRTMDYSKLNGAHELFVIMFRKSSGFPRKRKHSAGAVQIDNGTGEAREKGIEC